MSKSSKTKSHIGLGRGMDSLLPQDFNADLLLDSSERVQKISLSDIKANPDQPRKVFDEDSLKELAQSIKEYGILQPLIVTPISGNGYQIIAGERRFRASKLAGLTSIPAIVRTTKEIEKLEVALVENVQRVDLSPLEQAASIERLHQQFNLSYQEIGKRLGKASSTVTNTSRLLGLPPDAAQALREGKIYEGHARSILALNGMPDEQAELLKSIIEKGWNVRQAERFVIAVKKSGESDVSKIHARVDLESPETKQLGQRLNTSVAIRRSAHGGRLEINFKNDQDLERIINQLMP